MAVAVATAALIAGMGEAGTAVAVQQEISITQYNIRGNLSYLLEVNVVLLRVIENIRDSLQRQKVARRDIL
jgi:hypothetical protein